MIKMRRSLQIDGCIVYGNHTIVFKTNTSKNNYKDFTAVIATTQCAWLVTRNLHGHIFSAL